MIWYRTFGNDVDLSIVICCEAMRNGGVARDGDDAGGYGGQCLREAEKGTIAGEDGSPVEVAEDECRWSIGNRNADGSSIGDGVDVEAGVNVRLVGNEVVYAIGDTLEITDSRLDQARL